MWSLYVYMLYQVDPKWISKAFTPISGVYANSLGRHGKRSIETCGNASCFGLCLFFLFLEVQKVSAASAPLSSVHQSPRVIHFANSWNFFAPKAFSGSF